MKKVDQKPAISDRVLRIAEAAKKVGLGKTNFYEKAKHPDFPRAIILGRYARGTPRTSSMRGSGANRVQNSRHQRTTRFCSPAIDAHAITVSLGGRWQGHYGVAPCPVCQPEGRADQTALTITDGVKGVLVHCKKMDCDFRSILAAVGVEAGVFVRPDTSADVRRHSDWRAEAERRAAVALRVWKEATPIRGTIAEVYLRNRGVTCALPDTLRFHPECWHGPSALRWPAMLARVDGALHFSLHRTFLSPDSAGKAQITPDKAMLGGTAGGAVRLSSASLWLVVAEGIETALSLLSGLLGAPATVWAALSTSGLRALDLPDCPGRLTVACDGDAPGRAAAMALAERAHALNWQVGLLDPGDNLDFNDLLTEKAVAKCL